MVGFFTRSQPQQAVIPNSSDTASPERVRKQKALQALGALPPFSPILTRLLATLAEEDVSFAAANQYINSTGESILIRNTDSADPAVIESLGLNTSELQTLLFEFRAENEAMASYFR